jgi:ATP-dependent helicase/DNAse subunit B
VPITLVTGPANAGKAHFVMEAVRSHVARAEAPLLVVPTEADQARYRRELAEGGVVLGARIERFEGLLSEVVARAGLAEAPLGELARERSLARLADARPGMASALARLVGELEIERVAPARLRGALAAWGGAQATLERLCAVYESYHDALFKMRRADRELRVTRALDALRRRPFLWRSTPVLLYGFDDLTELQLDAIETLGGVVEARITVALAYEPGRIVFAGRAATFQRLAPLADSHTSLQARAEYYAPRARDALHHLERSLLTDDPRRVEPGDAVRLLAGGSPRAELELVAGEVRALLDAGVPAGEIAIVHRSPGTIAGLIGEVLDSFDIPHALCVPVRFAHTAVGRGLLGLLRCALADGELDDLLAWLRAPGVLDRPELADRLEASARRRGAIGAGQARVLWEAEHWPLDRIDRMRRAAAEGMVALADALIAESQSLFCAPRRGLAAVLGEDELHEARALAGARRALEELRELARAAPSLAPLPSELIDVLDALELADLERPRTGRVAVVDPLSLRARRVRMVFACGLQEGVFPAAPVPHPLLGEHDRRTLAQASGLVLRGEPDTLAAERYLLYALASRPEERLTLSWHTADEDGAPLARSLFVDDVCDLFADALRERTERRYAGAAGWPGPGQPAGAIAIRDTTTEPATARARPRPIARLSDERVLGELRERALWSASSLECWAGCPVKWFVERFLRPGTIDPDPEPIARGGLAHAALKDTLERLRERTGSARLTPASADLAKRLLAEALARQEPAYPLSVAPERVPGARRRLLADLERYLDCAAEQSSPLQPTHLELEFGFGDERGLGCAGDQDVSETGLSCERDAEPASSSLPALELGEGVLLRGRIDRVDVGPQGEAVVYDYKGRLAPPGARWMGDRAFQVALYMRAVERLLGYTPVGGFYQPLAGRDIRARGVLDGDSGVELACVRTDRAERSELDELLRQCVAAALRAAAEARSGALEPRPDTCAYGGGCAYPTICRCEG